MIDQSDDNADYAVRQYEASDAAAVNQLAREGLLPGHADHRDQATTADPHGSAAGHPTPETFWVVESQGEIVGSIALMQSASETGRLLQLRVSPQFKDDPRVPRLLVRAAAERARERGVIKIIIESPGLDIRPATDGESSIVTYLRSLGFEYTRTQESNGRAMLEFYLNLYEGPGTTPEQAR